MSPTLVKTPSGTAPCGGRDRGVRFNLRSVRTGWERDTGRDSQYSLHRVPDIGRQQETHADEVLCPFFSTRKKLPLSLLGSITIELDLGDYNDCFSVDAAHPNLWEISQPEILVDTISVDSSHHCYLAGASR